MERFKDYKEFTDYLDSHYDMSESTVKNYTFNKDNGDKIFYLTGHFIEVKKKSKNWFKRIFGWKEFDEENSNYGFVLNPITFIEVLCPMLESVDIKYQCVNGEVYCSRVKVTDIYHY